MAIIKKILDKSLAAAATTPSTPTLMKLSKTSPTSTTLSSNSSPASKSSSKLKKGLPGYLLDHVDDGSGNPVWSKAGTINSLEALKETDVKKASVQELINIVALKRFFRNYFSDFKKEYLNSSDSLLRSQQDAQGKKLISKSHPKAVDIGLVELGILIPDPVLEIVDTVDII